MIAIGGKLRILREKKPNRITDAHYDLMDRETFTGLLANQRIEVVINGKKKRTSVAEIWLAHEGRRTYENGLGMYPNMDPPDGTFNTWNGFAVEPKEGDCHLFLDHIHKIVCAGDDTINTWVLDWIADLVQDPADPKGCAIVMRGGEGAGKGVLANTVGELFGPHHKHLIDDSHLTSNFNAHLLDAVTLFADEITWGGNKKTAGKLKGMVTEKRLVGERKGVDAVQYDNMVHLMIASNSKWVVPAGSDSRRWMVLDVPTTKRGNVAYFNALFAEIKNGGREAFLWEMLHRGLSSNLRQAPETEALQEQRMLAISQDTTFDWWRECIMKGNMRCNHFKGEVEKWPRLVDKTELYDVYRDHCIGTKMDHDPIHVWAKEMVQYGIQPSRNRRGVEKIYTFKIPTHENAITHLNAIMAGAIENEDEEDDETDND